MDPSSIGRDFSPGSFRKNLGNFPEKKRKSCRNLAKKMPDFFPGPTLISTKTEFARPKLNIPSKKNRSKIGNRDGTVTVTGEN